MGINTDLNIAPYHDDYDETKQYVRVLFKPARAVQARELTQLQTTLQNQIERFGNNVYQDGTIIEGVNPTVDNEMSFVKINDQSAITDLSIFASTDEISYFLSGETSGLKAKIYAGANGFQTDAPNLKTFFVKYLLSSIPDATTGTEYKQFVGGESLTITRQLEGQTESVVSNVTAASSTATDGTVNNVGKSLAVTVTDGIIYQNGHFNYVGEQLIIASKYTDVPDNVSVGFDIEETIVNSALDSSLLDNAQGFNNQNAPGADRLKLQPKLAVYTTTTRPVDFFALLRIERGETVFVRGETQFNSINRELAKRTFDESGNYVVDGFRVTTEKDSDDGKFYAVVSPGKAYAFGYEVQTVGNQRLEITPEASTNTKTNQSVGVEYGAWLTVDVSGTTNFEAFDFSSRYNLYSTDYNPSGDANVEGTDDQPIGTCSIRSIEGVGENKLRMYIYGIDKVDANRFDTIGFIGSTVAVNKTPVIATSSISNISQANKSTMIFESGRTGMKSISNVAYIEKQIESYANNPINTTNTSMVQIDETLNGTLTITPYVEATLSSGGVFGVSDANHYVEATQTTYQTGTNNIEVEFPTGHNITHIYYNAKVSGTTHDTLEDVSSWVSTTFSKPLNFASLGLPNCVRLNKVEYEESSGNWVDVTSRFSLIGNQKDGYYDVSYLSLKQGQTMEDDSTTIRVNVVALRRVVNGGYITPNSYSGVTDAADLMKSFRGRDGVIYGLLDCYDFRPYADISTQYFTAPGNAAPVTVQQLAFDPDRGSPAIVANTPITGTQEYYLPRYDKLAIDKSQNFVLIKGQPADSPGKVYNDTVFGIADILVPGNDLSKNNSNAIVVERNTTRRLSMEDLQKLERKVNIQTEILALSLLEQSTKDRFIPDANGNNRFKNGILVDQFKNLDIADLTDSEFKASIHPSRSILAPEMQQTTVDLKIDTSSNVTTFEDVTTLSSTSSEVMLFQENATNTRNLASNFYKFSGSMQMAPQFDASYDIHKNPDVNIEIDFHQFAVDFLDNMQKYYPMSQDTFSHTTIGGVTHEQAAKGYYETTTYNDWYRKDSLQMNEYVSQQALGKYITDFAMEPFMAAKSIKVYVAGLRPNTRHYFYFDKKPVSQFVAPGGVYEADITTGAGGRSIKANDVFKNGAVGAQVTTDEFGKLFAVFDLPEGMFHIGDADLTISDASQFTDIDSSGTSFARQTYHSYAFAMSETNLGTNIRMADPEIESEIFLQEREIRQYVHTNDPLAQTFYVDTVHGEGSSYLFVDKIDVWFKKKSPADRKNGITVQMREVQNGYPTAKVLPTGSKHVDWSLINVSDDAETPTVVTFDNPIKLEVGKEYSLVIIPDATDPDYRIFTARVGEPTITDDSVRVATDWGMGVLFTSTNNRAWQSYQNEDIKFKMYKKIFTTEPGYVDLIPKDMEFFTLSNNSGFFVQDELVYVQAQASAGAEIQQFQSVITSDRKLQVGSLTATQNTNFLQFITNESLVILTQGTEKTHVSIVESITPDANDSSMHYVKLKDAPPASFATNTTCTITQGVGGKVASFDPNNITKLAIKESTSAPGSNTKFLLNGDQILRGAQSGAAARIQTIYNAPISFVQPQLMELNTLVTNTSLHLFKHSASHDENLGINNSGQQIGLARNTYLSEEQRFIPSKQLIIEDGELNTIDKFRFRVGLTNNGYRMTTPTVDTSLALTQAYNYTMSNVEDNTSQYVSKKVVLQPDHPAEGLRVILAAFRPAGSEIDVQVRFLLPSDPDNYTDWVSLKNHNPSMYSSSTNVNDFREFDYEFDEQAFITGGGTPEVSDFDAFQIKIVLKHEQAGTGSNIYPHVYDYRAIALT